MNLNIVNNFDEILQFLQNTMSQLKNYNSINETDLKLLCYLMYKQDTIERNKEIHPLLLTTLSFINEETKIYFNHPFELKDTNKIYKAYLNNNLKKIFGE